MTDHWSRAGRMLRALFDAPEFLAGERVLGISGLGAQADQLPPSVDHPDVRRRKSFAKVAVRRNLSVRVNVLKVYRPFRLPDRLAGLLVQREDELAVAAVEMHDQPVEKKNRRRSRAAEMVALDIAGFPERLVSLCV